MLRRAVTGLIAALLLAGALAGCGGGSSPGSSRTVTVSPSPSSPAVSSPAPDGSGSPSAPRSPSSAAPRTGPLTTGPGVKPGEKPPVESRYAKQHNTAGALAFAGYFIQALDWSIATNDPYLLKQISAASCQPCRAYIDGLTGLRKEGKSQVGGRISIRSSAIVHGSFRVKSDYVIEFKLHQSGAVVGASGAPTPSSTPAGTDFASLVFVSWADHSWRVVEQGAPS